MPDALSFDELNRMVSYEQMFADAESLIRQTWYEHMGTAELKKSLEDVLADILLYAYVRGIQTTDRDLFPGSEETRRFMSVDATTSNFSRALNYVVGGKSISDRIGDHVREGSLERMITLTETEVHRMFSTGSLQEAEAASKSMGLPVSKTWHTMEDERVREEHAYLDNVSVDLHDRFYVYDDSAFAPGGFSKVENNARCRCWLTYKVV